MMITMKTFFLTVILTSALAFPAQQPAPAFTASQSRASHLPDPKIHKFYFDYGTETLDAGYEPYQLKMDQVIRSAGYKEGKNWLTRKFAGAVHSEKSWSQRLDVR